MKNAFSLLELIFAIVIIGIIASFAVPKYIDTKNHALASTIKRDIITISSSIQTHYLINRKVDKISDAININSTNWEIADKSIIFKENEKSCVELSINKNIVKIVLDKDVGNVCKALDSLGVVSMDITL